MPGDRDMKESFKVLVADSNRNVREFLRRELALAGYEVVTSGNSRRLFTAIEKDGLLDLLVVDPEMPLLDERTLCGLLDGRLPPLHMILYGYGEECRNRYSLPRGCTVVERGEDVDSLKEAVRRELMSCYPQRFSRWRSSAQGPPGSWCGTGSPKLRLP